ncbi:importin beta11 [Augochlora pura]
MAILCFKNGVEKYWRTTAPNAIAEDEKEFLRQRLISNFDEPVNQLAVQLAALIGRIARFDCPKEWGTLIPTILDVVRGQNPLAQHRALLTLHHVIKSLASKCFILDRRYFRILTVNVFSFILNLWNTYTESFIILASNGADANQIQEALEKALILLRILRKLILHGFESTEVPQEATLLLEAVFERAKTCLECRKTLISRGIQLEACDKFMILWIKVLIGIHEIYSKLHIELIPTSIKFSVFYCFTEAGQNVAFEGFTIQCLNLLKRIVTRHQYSSYSRRKRDSNYLRLTKLIQENFSPETLVEICSKLVTHYFLLTPADLELWDTDPEHFFFDDVGEVSKYSLRPCSETVFTDFFYRFRDILAPVLVDLMQKHHQPVDPNNLHAILLKDAVYNAVGLAAFYLYDEVNFDQWFSTTLKEELKIRNNNYRIIRRRVCWLIGQWSSIKLSRGLRPMVYELMVEVLSPEEDLGVRLAASDALKLIIDDFQFNPEEFSPYLEPACTLLISLLKEVTEWDTKMRVLYVLSFMIERVGSEINPYVGVLSSYLPILWQQSDQQNMLRCAIITTLVHLEKTLGPESVIIQPLVTGVVAFSCDVNQSDHVYLLEDGLRLWSTLLENAPAPTPDIMDLAKNLCALIDQSGENLELCLHIVQVYAILSPQEFLSQRGVFVVETLRSIISDLKSEGVVMVFMVFDTFMCAAARQGAELIKPALVTVFENVCKEQDSIQVIIICLLIVARVLWFYKDIFIQVISELARKIGGNETSEEEVIGKIIHVWVIQMPVVFQPERRKLLALALCSLLGANSPPSVLECFPLIISNIVETLNDISKFDNLEYDCIGSAIESLTIGGQPDEEDNSDYVSEHEDYGNEHEQRKRRLVRTDVITTISLKDTLQNQLLTLRGIVGENQFNQMMSTLDPAIDKQLKFYISL